MLRKAELHREADGQQSGANALETDADVRPGGLRLVLPRDDEEGDEAENGANAHGAYPRGDLLQTRAESEQTEMLAAHDT